MPKWFNTAGPCKADIHYRLSPLGRLPQLKRLVAQQGYFVIHAPRQTGKTTAMLALAQELTDSGQYTAVMLSVEVGAPYPHSPDAAEVAILGEWRRAAVFSLPVELQPPPWNDLAPGSRISAALGLWTQASPRPLVIFIDEIDALQDETLISILRQLRSGYPSRPQGFPYSLALVGVRDGRDYKVASGGSDRLNTSSPFNIKLKSLTLRNFTALEVAELYQQHTDATGQVLTPEAMAKAHTLTQGQPWLVNALANEIVEELVTDSTQSITVEHIETAKEILIRRQDTHLDSLVNVLQNDRVKAIFEPMLAGQELGSIPDDDRQFLLDLGLIARHPSGGIVLANPIYQEILPRVLASNTQDSLPLIAPSTLSSKK